jgi:hypothetical protein
MSPEDAAHLRRYDGAGAVREARIRAATWANLVADLTEILRKARPEVIVAAHARVEHAQIYLYATHIRGAPAFPHGPAGAALGPPPWFDATTPFRGYFSLPVTPQTRILKLFAFDAGHDVGHAPPPPDYSLKHQFRTLRSTARRLLSSWADDDPGSAYRRALRGNEQFFVYPGGEACALRAAALATLKVADTSRCVQ